MVIKKYIINQVSYSYSITKRDQGFEVVCTDQNDQVTTFLVTDYEVKDAGKRVVFTIDNKRHLADVVEQPGQHAVFLSEVNNRFVIQSDLPKSSVSSGLFSPALVVDASHKMTSEHALQSPLAGRVTKLLVQAGQSVVAGQPLVLIESMKMENEICAPRPAYIKTILIAEGNVVQPEQILIEFGKEGEKDATAQGSDEQETVSHR